MNPDLENLLDCGDSKGLQRLLSESRVSEANLDRALRRAVALGNVDLFGILLDHGARLDSRHEHTGWPLLHTAVEHGQEESIRQLIQLGADKDAVDPTGASALHLAIDVQSDAAYQASRDPDWTIVELLLRLGVDPSIRDSGGRTAKDWSDLAEVKSPLNR